IAASRPKGTLMVAPYRWVTMSRVGELIVNEAGAQTVREIFELMCGCGPGDAVQSGTLVGSWPSLELPPARPSSTTGRARPACWRRAGSAPVASRAGGAKSFCLRLEVREPPRLGAPIDAILVLTAKVPAKDIGLGDGVGHPVSRA